MGEAVVDYLVDFVHGLDDAPAEATEGGIELARTLRGGAAGGGRRFRRAVRADAAERRPGRSSTPAPATSPTSPAGVCTRRRSPSSWRRASTATSTCGSPRPAMVQIEQNVIRWLCDLFDYPETARGLLTSGGSMANFSAIVTARHAKLGEDFLDGTYYVSEQVHASVSKAANLAGLLPAEPPAGPDRPPAADGRGCAPRHGGGRPRGRPPSVPGGPVAPGRRTPARSIRWTTSPTSRPSPGCGCTWMRPTAASSS